MYLLDLCLCGCLTNHGLKRRSRQKGPLVGVKVVDLSQVIAGPLSTRPLADFGAEVIKVESFTQPDVARAAGCAPVRGLATMFTALNVGKRGLALDLKQEKGKDALCRLLKDADVLVQNFRPGAMESLGLSYEDIQRINPNIIYVSSSGFGPGGPRCRTRIYDPVVQAVAGGCQSQADLVTGAPRLVGQAFIDKCTGLMTCSAILAALHARGEGHGGQKIEVSMLRCGIYFLFSDALWNHVWLPADGGSSGQVPLFSACHRVWEASDGALHFSALKSSSWPGLVAALQKLGHCDARLGDKGLSTVRGRLNNWDAVAGAIQTSISKSSVQEVAEVFQRFKVPFALGSTTFAEASAKGHAKATMDVKHALFGKFQIAKRPVTFSRTPTLESVVPPFMPGEHTVQCLREAGYAPQEITEMLQSGSAISTASYLEKAQDAKKARVFRLLEKVQGSSSWNQQMPSAASSKMSLQSPSAGPLDGVRVLEISGRSTRTCSFAAMVLGDQGATVTKIEDCAIGDDARELGGTPSREWEYMGASHMILNRNKHSVILDTASAKSKDVHGDAVRKALANLANCHTIILADNEGQEIFPPRLALAENTKLVYVAIDDRPDVQLQGSTGSINANLDAAGRPSAIYQFLTEKYTGLIAASAATAGVIAGTGQVVTVKAVETSMFLNMLDVGWNTCWEKKVLSKPGAQPGFPPFQKIYKLWDTSDRQQGLQVFGANDNEANALFRAVERPDWSEKPEWKTIIDRIKDIDNMYESLQAELVKMPTERALANMVREDCGHAEVNDFNEVLNDPQVIHDQFIQLVPHERTGYNYCFPASPMSFSKTPANTLRSHAPEHGEHTMQILSEAGLSLDEIAAVETN